MPSLQQLVGELAFAANVGETLLPALEQEGQPFVVQAEQLQDSRVQVVDVDTILDGAEAEFVGGANDLSALDAAARQHRGKAVGVVVAAGGPVRVAPVGDRRAAELAPPDDQRL